MDAEQGNRRKVLCKVLFLWQLVMVSYVIVKDGRGMEVVMDAPTGKGNFVARSGLQ